MCGIAGVLRIHTPDDGIAPLPLVAIPEAWLDALDESIKHRGPDGQGRFRDRAVRPDGTVVDIALVHRRLSILDHAGGHQPMVHDGSVLHADLTYQPGETPKLAHELAPGMPLVAVVFNGCIYKHRELRSELELLGHRFETDHSDTEVLVHGWRAWRKGLQGVLLDSSMYAAAVWDRQSADLVTFRDCFGQKPLVIASPTLTPQSDMAEARTWFFASSPAALPRLLPAHNASKSALPSWIIFGHDPEMLPMLPAFTVERQSVGRLTPWSDALERSEADSRSLQRLDKKLSKAYIEPVEGARKLPLTLRQAVARHHEPIDILLRQCVQERLEADVPIACLLSGGVDSSLIAAYAQQLTGRLSTVCVRMPDARYDESKYAKEVAEHLGTDHHEIECDADASSDLVHLIEQMGVPFGDSSLLPTYWACRGAKSKAGVLLTGDGGDEMFIGYERYFAAANLWEELALVMSPISRVIPMGCLPQRDPKSVWSKAARWMQMSRTLSYGSLLAMFSPADARRLLGSNAVLPEAMDLESSPWLARAHDLDFTLPGDYLRKVDAASMAVPVETRAPFLDRRLKLATDQLGAKLIASGRKGFLRDIARKYLPDRIIDRSKQGFAIPVGEWFRTDYGGMRQLLYDHLESSDPFPGLADAGVELNMSFVRQILREHDAAGENSWNPWHGRDHSQRLYGLLVLSIWSKWLNREQDSLLGGSND
jgi:asparagine synthase (glutamine-hydrolysing)